MALTDAEKIHFEVVVRGTLAALGGVIQLTITPLHYRRTNFGTAYSAAELVAAFHTAIKTAWKAAVSSSWTWDATTVRCINSPTEAEAVTIVGEGGSIVGDPQPGFVAQVLSKRTALRGRSYQGRLYLAGVAETSTTGNAVTVPQGILLDTLSTALGGSITTAAGLTYVPGVLSRALSELTSDPADITMTDISSVIKRTVLGRLLSRKSPLA